LTHLNSPDSFFDFSLYATESYSGKKGEIWQQGDLHGKDRNRDTEDPIAGNYQDNVKKFQYQVISFPLQEQDKCTTVHTIFRRHF